MIKKAVLSIIILLLLVINSLQAKDYNASFFGIQSNGTTLNTTSIQKAVDYIHENGGGRLIFYVGRYLTGTIHLKSNVTIHLEEGAILVGSVNPFDYERIGYWTSLIFAHNQENIGITGKGVIDGQGFQIANNILDMVHRGIIDDCRNLAYDLPCEGVRPQNIYFKDCKWYGNRVYNVSDKLRLGVNIIDVRVVTTMGNYMKSLTDNPIAQKWTNKGKKDQPLQSMGLVGSVRLYN